MLETTVYLDRIGRWMWRVTASTVPAGGTRVDVWHVWGRARAERKASKVSHARNRPPRYASDTRAIPPAEPRCNPVGGVHALWCPDRPIPPGTWDDDPNHPEGSDCHGEPLSSGERCGRKQHAPYVPGGKP